MWSSSSTGLTKWLSGQASWSSSFWSSDGWSSAWWRWLSWSSLSNHPDLQVIDGKRTVWKGNVQQQPWVQFDLVVETFVSKVNQIFQFIFLYFHLLTVVIIIWIVLVFETFASKIILVNWCFWLLGCFRDLQLCCVRRLWWCWSACWGGQDGGDDGDGDEVDKMVVGVPLRFVRCVYNISMLGYHC